MNISGVDFSTDLLKALRDSDLVVFAGAGVSMGPPASLPNFSGLAKEVAAGTGEVRGEDEPEDRFLVALFSSFPVLFIGYSHNDVVMNYLARALTVSDKQRYVLAASDEAEAERKKWELLGIQRIEYLKWPDDDHRGLQEAISGLANFARRDSNDWKIRITEIAEQPPSDDEEQMDLIDFALSDAGLTGHFTAADTPPEGIRWLAKREDIGGLFIIDSDYNLDERDRHLSRWLAERFAREQADQLFDLIRGR